MQTREAQRLTFIRKLSTMDEAARAHLLRIETEEELRWLAVIAMEHGYADVAVSVDAAACQ